MDSDKLLGEFLRAQREVVTPEQVGLPDVDPLRSPGLCREEVATLAGVSPDYYTRLEQGLECRPSEQVLDALVLALGLDSETATHLYELAKPRPPRSRTARPMEQVGPDLLRLMNDWRYTPAMVCGPRMDVLAVNPVASVLYGALEYPDNLLRMVFLSPSAREFYRDWEQVARSRVTYLRAAVGPNLDDPHLSELISELLDESADFRRMWAGPDKVCGPTRQAKHLYRHEVGELTLTCEVFNIASAPGQQMITLHAKPGSPSECALTMLGSLAALAPPATEDLVAGH
jgi:transcriptional regulator with XRE-family HTH domain